MDVNWNYNQFNALYEQPDDPDDVELQPNCDYTTMDCGTLDLQNLCIETIDDPQNETEHSEFFNDEMNMNPYVGSDGNYLTCTLCMGNNANFMCIDPKHMIKHLWDIHKEKLYICNDCNEQFHYDFELYKHLKTHVSKSSNKKWECNECPRKFVSKNLLEEHEYVHNGLRPYQCTECEKTYRSKYTLKTHLKTHQPRNREYHCMSCYKSFLSKQNLKQHEETHKDTKEFSCTLCDNRKFTTENNLISHMIIHDGNKKFSCATCNKRFARKAELRDHERIHTGQRPFGCTACGATFTQRSNLKSHINATHLNLKKNICEECGKGFKRKRLLTYHINAVHTKIRPYKCTECPKDFVYPEHLKKHMLNLHENEKPFSCCICNKNFSSRDNYNSHLYSHTTKKQYECLTCGVGFTRKPALKNHIETAQHEKSRYISNRIVSIDKVISSDVNTDGGKNPEENSWFLETKPEVRQMDEMTNLYVENVFIDENIDQDYENTDQYYENTEQYYENTEQYYENTEQYNSNIQDANETCQLVHDQYGTEYWVVVNPDEILQDGYENDNIALLTESYSNEYDNNQKNPMNCDQGRLHQVQYLVGNEIKYMLCEVGP